MTIKVTFRGRASLATAGIVLAAALLASPACEAATNSFAGLAPKAGPCPHYSPAVDADINGAYELADHAVPAGMISAYFIVPRVVGLCAPARVPAFHLDASIAKPAKAFDQLYYVGNHFVGSWALQTSGGIILFDTMDNTHEARDIIVPGLRSLGLDPASIKYIVITHGHADHWGGARYLQETYHPHILMGAKDWTLAEAPSPRKRFAGRPYPTPPKRDMTIANGEQLTLGNTTITLYLAPGHTPGAMAAIIPVTDHGKPHTLMLFGGNGLPPYLEPDKCSPQRQAGMRTYIDSVRRMLRAGKAAGVDGVISTHPIFDGTDVNIEKIRTRKPGAPNPWVLGKRGYVRYMKVLGQVAKTVETMEEEHPVPMRCGL